MCSKKQLRKESTGCSSWVNAIKKKAIATDSIQTHAYYDKTSEHKWSKKSKIKNIGEDIDGSARHERNLHRDWSSLEELMNASNKTKITSEKLDALDPIDWMSFVEGEDDIHGLERIVSLKMYLEKFKKKPTDGYSPESFIEDYQSLKHEAKRLASDNSLSGPKATSELQHFANQLARDIRSKRNDFRDANANNRIDALNRFWNARANNKTSAMQELAKLKLDQYPKDGNRVHFGELMARELSDVQKSGYLSALKARLGGVGKKTIKSGSTGRNQGPKESDFYKSDGKSFLISEEKGHVRDEISAQAFLSNIGVRGIQFGNSLPDKERSMHLIAAANSFKDLAEIYGIPTQSTTFGGSLGLSFGARGKAGSVAHYDPSVNTLAFNRSTGFGALAHEWAHGLSHNIQKNGSHEARNALMELKVKITTGSMAKRIRESETLKTVSYKRRNYWMSPEELLARTVETYTTSKLEGLGRKNSYLAFGVESELWPTQAEASEVGPLIDRLMATLKG